VVTVVSELADLGKAAVLAEAWRRAKVVERWAQPWRSAPKVLPESLPAGVPPAATFYEQVLEERR
jgi:hypothetical protein